MIYVSGEAPFRNAQSLIKAAPVAGNACADRTGSFGLPAAFRPLVFFAASVGDPRWPSRMLARKPVYGLLHALIGQNSRPAI
jgi:hypothetical protein